MAARSVEQVCCLFRRVLNFQQRKHFAIRFPISRSNVPTVLQTSRLLCTATTTTTTTTTAATTTTTIEASTASSSSEEVRNRNRQMMRLYISHDIQELLYRITGFDVERVFAPVKKATRRPMYKFMTDDELKRAQEEAKQRGLQRLQMPPYLRYAEKPLNVISKDPEIQGLISHNLVCMDISPGQTRKSRIIVVRQPDGLLRDAIPDERKRINQVYYPRLGREIQMPVMFEPELLEDVLAREEYLFVLDRACLQFEPFDSDYVRVTEATYRHVDKRKKYDMLRSTRHFGPMTFCLVLEDNVEGLMIDMIQRLLLNDAVDLAQLYWRVHNPDKWLQLQGVDDKKQILKIFASEDYQRSGQLQLVVQSLYEMDQRENEKAVN